MSNNTQKDAFLGYEANAWFQRNTNYIEQYSIHSDAIPQLLSKYSADPNKILEIGCSGGYRLHGLKQLYPNIEAHGIDPSSEAISYGRSKYNDIQIQEGTIDNLSNYKDEEFDVLIIGFVFYVVDRTLLLRSIAEVDRVLHNNGLLIIKDFFSEVPLKKRYHHISDVEAYTYKQNYDQIFISSGGYHLLSKDCFNHTDSEQDHRTSFQDLYSISLLKKDLYSVYK